MPRADSCNVAQEVFFSTPTPTCKHQETYNICEIKVSVNGVIIIASCDLTADWSGCMLLSFIQPIGEGIRTYYVQVDGASFSKPYHNWLSIHDINKSKFMLEG